MARDCHYILAFEPRFPSRATPGWELFGARFARVKFASRRPIDGRSYAMPIGMNHSKISSLMIVVRNAKGDIVKSDAVSIPQLERRFPMKALRHRADTGNRFGRWFAR